VSGGGPSGISGGPEGMGGAGGGGATGGGGGGGVAGRPEAPLPADPGLRKNDGRPGSCPSTIRPDYGRKRRGESTFEGQMRVRRPRGRWPRTAPGDARRRRRAGRSS